jgi:hypothetical protein
MVKPSCVDAGVAALWREPNRPFTPILYARQKDTGGSPMLGIGPKPEGGTVVAPDVYSAPYMGALLALLGISALILLALMPATFGLGWLSMALFGLPLAAGGACGALMGYLALSMRIEITQGGVAITTPGWRACPFPPVRQYQLRWSDVRAVHHRSEIYRIGLLPVRLRLEAYAIETADGFIPFGSYYLSNLEPVLIEIGHRADCHWQDDDEVRAGLFRTLLFGGPSWPALDRHPLRPASDIASRTRRAYGACIPAARRMRSAPPL